MRSSMRCDLKAALADWIYEAVGQHAISDMSLDELNAGSTESIVADLLHEVRIPVVEIAETHEHYGAPQDGPDLWVEEVQARVRSMVWTVGWNVSGPSERLQLWPRDARPLPPTNEELRKQANSPFKPNSWGLPQFVFTHDQSVVYTYIVVTNLTEIGDWVDQIDSEATKRRGLLLELLRAQRSQEELVLAEVTQQLEAMCDVRRESLAWERTKEQALTLRPHRLEFPALQPVTARQPPSERESSVDETQLAKDEPVSLARYELDQVSFEAILDSIHRWGRAVEEGAGNLKDFSEDGLTTTLCAGLTIAYGIALHSVFVHQGKSDIYIPMEAVAKLNDVPLPTDQEHAFIAEAKKRGGEKLAEDALDQLDRYLPNRVPRGALVFYLTHLNFTGARDRVLEALRGQAKAEHEWRTPAGVPVLVVWDESEKIDREIGVLCIPIPERNNGESETQRDVDD